MGEIPVEYTFYTQFLYHRHMKKKDTHNSRDLISSPDNQFNLTALKKLLDRMKNKYL